MTAPRPMGEMLADVAEGALAAAGRTGLRATSIEVSLPVDIGFGQGRDLTAELPRFLTRTAFDAPPSRLKLVWEITP